MSAHANTLINAVLGDPPSTISPTTSFADSRHALSSSRSGAAEHQTAVRTLIVDDDADLRDSLRFLLEMEGYEVDEARDGIEALDALRASLHGLVVLLDLVMPRLGGMDVLRAVADDARLAERHVFVIVTANRDKVQPAARALLQQLAVPVVTKPYDVDDLLEVVARIATRLDR